MPKLYSASLLYSKIPFSFLYRALYMKTYNNNSVLQKFFPLHYIPQDSHGARKTLLLRQYFDNSCQKQFKETKLETKEPPKKKRLNDMHKHA